MTSLYPEFSISQYTGINLSPCKIETTYGKLPSTSSLILSTSLYAPPELPNFNRDWICPRRSQTFAEAYLEPYKKFRESSPLPLIIHLDPLLVSLLPKLTSPLTEIRLMSNRLAGHNMMLWRYLSAEKHGNIRFCGMDAFGAPDIVRYLATTQPQHSLIRWGSSPDLIANGHQICYRPVHGAFYLRDQDLDIFFVISDFLKKLHTNSSIMGWADGDYGLDEVFCARYFYHLHRSSLATCVSHGTRSTFLRKLDIPYINEANPNHTIVYYK
jgi:hypothetical protein